MDFTVTLKQNAASVAATTRDATFVVRDGWVHGHIFLDITAAGTVGTELKITPDSTLPDPADSYAGSGCGTFFYVDTGTGYYIGGVIWDGTDLRFVAHLETNYLGADPSFAAANTDSIRVEFAYRHA